MNYKWLSRRELVIHSQKNRLLIAEYSLLLCSYRPDKYNLPNLPNCVSTNSPEQCMRSEQVEFSSNNIENFFGSQEKSQLPSAVTIPAATSS